MKDYTEYKRVWYQKHRESLSKKRKLYYLAHKTTFAERSLASKERGRTFIYTYKAVPCMDCGMTFPPVCMDFDHRPNEEKLFDVGPNIGLNIARLRKEIAKCDVVCACCHRLRTQERKRKAMKGP